MRRPTGPAQRAQPARPATPSPADGATQARASVLVDEHDHTLTEPVELFPTARAATAEPTKRQAEKDAGPAVGSRLDSWRTVRHAAAERRKVERGEARRFTARSRRRRRVQLVCAAVVVLVIGGGVGAAYSPLMSLKHIEVVGAHRVQASAVQQALKSELGTPLPLVKSDEVRRALDDFRLVESYSTQLQPPSTLVVTITERTPIAVVRSGTTYELVDQAGVIISATSTRPSGYPLVALKSGETPQASTGFAATAAVIAALPASVRATVTGASAASANAVTLTLSGGKTVVWGGTGQTRLKTAALNALLKGAASAHYYDVSSPKAPITK